MALVRCGHCGLVFVSPAALADRKVFCTGCGQAIEAPSAITDEPAPQPTTSDDGIASLEAIRPQPPLQLPRSQEDDGGVFWGSFLGALVGLVIGAIAGALFGLVVAVYTSGVSRNSFSSALVLLVMRGLDGAIVMGLLGAIPGSFLGALRATFRSSKSNLLGGTGGGALAGLVLGVLAGLLAAEFVFRHGWPWTSGVKLSSSEARKIFALVCALWGLAVGGISGFLGAVTGTLFLALRTWYAGGSFSGFLRALIGTLLLSFRSRDEDNLCKPR